MLNDLSSTSVDPGEQVIYVDSIFIYGGFKRGNSRNNFALVKLKAPVTDNKVCVQNTHTISLTFFFSFLFCFVLLY